MNTQRETIWKNIIIELSKEREQTTLPNWFANLKIKNIEDDRIIIQTPNAFISDWIAQNYREQLAGAIKAATGKKMKFVFEVHQDRRGDDEDDQARSLRKKTSRGQAERAIPPAHYGLDPKFTFETFVVGKSNQLAHAVCLAVSEKKARNYNPLFIYGGVGLGKTHLLNAVGNELYRQNPKLRMICIQAETFLNEMIQAIRSEKMDLFRKRYRKECDVLLMDDVEIIAGKERTQDEFFYTFNELYSADKKIIITSDKFPKEMQTLEERLRSRFESGIIVDIQPPELETRIAILRYLAEKEAIPIPDDVAIFLAESISSNIRKLEGSLIRLSAVASLSGMPITVELAEQVMRVVLNDPTATLSPEQIMKAVAAYFKIKVSDMKSPKRNRRFTVPRQIAMYLCRELSGMSFPEIGHAFGGRDHSTVIHSCKKIGIEKNTDFELRKHLDALTKKLKTGSG